MENNQQQLLIETQFEELTIYVRPDKTHEWLMETKLVAEAYGVSEETIRSHKSNHSSDLIDNKHFTSVESFNARNLKQIKTFWTKRGVIRLGFFIKSARAKLFRDWAEDLIIRELNHKDKYVTVEMLQKNNRQQDAKMHQYLDALYTKFSKDIHNLAERVDKLEGYMLIPHQLEEKQSHTYLFRKIDTNEYKIGKSNEPLDRIKTFTGAGTKMELILTIEFHNQEMALLWEKTLQKTFKHLNLHGEWFLLSSAEVELLWKISEAFEDFYQITSNKK
jgi:hypothetical protein